MKHSKRQSQVTAERAAEIEINTNFVLGAGLHSARSANSSSSHLLNKVGRYRNKLRESQKQLTYVKDDGAALQLNLASNSFKEPPSESQTRVNSERSLNQNLRHTCQNFFMAHEDSFMLKTSQDPKKRNYFKLESQDNAQPSGTHTARNSQTNTRSACKKDMVRTH